MQSLNLVNMFYVLAQLKICACNRSRNKARQRARKNDVGENIAETGSETKSGQGSHGNQSAKTGESSFGGKDFAKNFRNYYNRASDKKGQEETKRGQFTHIDRANPDGSNTEKAKMKQTRKISTYEVKFLMNNLAKAERDNTPDNMSKTGNPSTSGNHENADVNDYMFVKCQFLSTSLLYFVEHKIKVEKDTLKTLKHTFSEYLDDMLFESYQLDCRLVEAKNLHEQLLEFAIVFRNLALMLKNSKYINLGECMLDFLNHQKTKELVAKMAKTK